MVDALNWKKGNWKRTETYCRCKICNYELQDCYNCEANIDLVEFVYCQKGYHLCQDCGDELDSV